MASKNERRIFTAGQIQASEYRAGGPRQLSGYAAVFNSRTRIGPYFHEQLSRNCFRDSLANPKTDARFYWQHDADGLPLGRQSANTLRLAEDNHGLRFSLDLPDTEQGRALYAAVQRGDVTDMSFGFTVPDDGDEWQDDFTCSDEQCCARGSRPLPLRTINLANLFEISAVNTGAYSAAEVGASDSDGCGDPDSDDCENNARIVVPMEVRARAKKAPCRKPRFTSDDERKAHLAQITEQLDADRRRRLDAATKAIRGDAVGAELSEVRAELAAEAQANLDRKFAEDVANTRRAAFYMKYPHKFPGGSGPAYLDWLANFLRS